MYCPHIPWLHVVGAAFAYFALGGLWYSPVLFAKPWMRALDRKPEELGSPAIAMSVAALACLVSCIALAHLIGWAGFHGAAGGLKIGLVAGVGLVAVTSISDALFVATHWIVWALGAAYRAIGLALAGLIIGLGTPEPIEVLRHGAEETLKGFLGN